MDAGSLYLSGHSRTLHRPRTTLINFAPQRDRWANLPRGEQPQSATRPNDRKSSKPGNEYCANNFKLALPECFKGQPISCSSQTVALSLQKRD